MRPMPVLPRNVLHAILRAGLGRSNVCLDKAVVDIRQSPAGCQVTFSDGTTGAYDLVVGADGVNSTVRRIGFRQIRRAISAPSAGEPSPATRPASTAGRRCRQWPYPGAIPISPTDIYVYADIRVKKDAIGEFSARSPLTPLFAGFAAPVFPLIENLPASSEVHFGRIEQMQMAKWVKGRVVVIGDAAHASSPSMAEGGGMALEDALVLAEAIAAVPNLDRALAEYEARRRPRVEWVQAQCQARDRMRTLPALARSAILKVFGQTLYRRSYTPLLKPI